MNTIKRIMQLVENYRCAGGRDEHYFRKDLLQNYLEDVLGEGAAVVLSKYEAVVISNVLEKIKDTNPEIDVYRAINIIKRGL